MHKSKEIKGFLFLRRGLLSLVTPLLVGLMLLAGCAVVEPRHFPQETGDLLVEIKGFRSDEGVAFLSLFSVAGGFPDDISKAWQNQKLKINQGKSSALFKAVPYGKYALGVLHDEDSDGQMKSSWLGQPLEGFGFSGQPEYNFGPPSFTDAAFILLSKSRAIEIWMRYATARSERLREHRIFEDGKP